MTAEERIAPLEMEVAKERAKTARVEAELAAERAENASLRQQMEHNYHPAAQWSPNGVGARSRVPPRIS